MIPKTIAEMDINPKDQQDILEYIKTIDNKDVCEKLLDNMSTKAVLFCIDIIEAFNEFIE